MKVTLPALALFAALALASPLLAQTKPVQSRTKISDPPPAKPAPASEVDPAAAFMAKTGKESGVITLPSGLEYKVVHEGDPKGPSPKPGDVIKVHYEGKLVDGTVFDSSFARNQPMLAPLGGLVPGWMEALPLMHPGDEWTLYIPPALGYGPDGRGPIPANSVMIFRLQFLGMLSAN